jgi:hypothetical protein
LPTTRILRRPHLSIDGWRIKTVPSRLTAVDLARFRRKVSSRGGIQVARQRIQVGFSHAGKIVTHRKRETPA